MVLLAVLFVVAALVGHHRVLATRRRWDVWNDLATQCNHSTSTCPTGRLAIQVGQDIISAPTVQTDLFEGQVTITGAFTESDARSLAEVFVAGALSTD